MNHFGRRSRAGGGVRVPARRAGGSARSLATVLAHLGSDVHRVVACRPGTRFAGLVSTRRLAEEVVDLRAGSGGGGRGVTRRARRVADGIRLARWGLAHRHQVSAVHANGLAEAMLAWPLALGAAAPMVVWAHEWDVSPAARVLAPLMRRGVTLRWATVSDTAREALVASGVPGSKKVAVIPNPIDPAEMAASPEAEPATSPGEEVDEVEIAYLGAPATYKGFDLLPDLIDGVAHHRVPVRWRIWSGPRSQDPTTWARLESLAHEAGPEVQLEDKTAEVAHAYASADIVVCPSRQESFGRVAAEAMASGRAVVASDLPALRQVVGPAGVLVPPEDVTATVEALASLAADPRRRAELGAQGRIRARAWAPGPVVEALRVAYGLDRPRVLVVSHEATRTGAPAVAVEVVGALAPRARVEVVLRWPGPLAPDFARAGGSPDSGRAGGSPDSGRAGGSPDSGRAGGSPDSGRAGGMVRTEPLRHLRVLLRRNRRTRDAATRLERWAAGRVLDRSRPDLVWANTVLSACYLEPARARGIPAVLHVHELGRLIPGTLRRYGPGLLPAGVTVVAASQAAADATRPHLPPGERLAVIPSPIDVDAVAHRARQPQVLTDSPGPSLVVACGAATHRKGIDRWIEIAARVHDADPTVRFRWVGRDSPRMLPQVEARDLNRVVELLDEVEDPLPHLAGATVFTLPSRHDTFPLAVLEAMALGLPVVAFDAGGMAEQLGDTGVLIPADDLEAFADAVVDLIRDPGRRSDLAEAAIRRVRKFDRSGFAATVNALADEILADEILDTGPQATRGTAGPAT